MSETASSGSDHRGRVPLTTLASDAGSIPDDDSSFDSRGSSPSQSKMPGNIGISNKLLSHSPQKSPADLQSTAGRSHEYPPEDRNRRIQHAVSPGAPVTTANGRAHDLFPKDPKASKLILPELQIPSSTTDTTYYKYRAQLTFGLKPNKDGVNVAQLFKRWIFSSCESLPDFSLVPYEEPDKGQQITSTEQVPDENPSFYAMYYHNHRILQHGNLTGMVAFQCSIPWTQIKSPRSTFFSWLRMNNVYLNQTKFQTSTLVACGFLLGAHPGYTRRDHAEEELHHRLRLEEEDIPYQLSARTISVPLVQDKPEKFSFQAVVVETSAKNASALRERFYSLDHPAKAIQAFPYTGKYQFVPMLNSKEWTVPKILRLAKLHVQMVSELKPIFVANLQDLRNEITPTGSTLMQGFYGMQFKQAINNLVLDPVPLLHSIHNTGNKTTKVALVPASHYSEALSQLSAIHSILTSNVAPEFHDRVFLPGAQAGVTGQQVDSVSSCNCSSYASELLNLYNPQDGEDEIPQPTKRFRPIPMTYAAVTTQTAQTGQTKNSITPTSISSLTNEDINQLYDRMKHHLDPSLGQSITLTAEELEQKISQSNLEIQEVKQQLQQTVQDLTGQVSNLAVEINRQNVLVTGQVDHLKGEISKQNVIILGIQKEFQQHMADISAQLREIYSSQNQQHATPSASTSKTGQWGSNIK